MFFAPHEPLSEPFTPPPPAPALADLLRPLRRRPRSRRADRAMLSLDDRTLTDIGLRRSEVLAMVYGPKTARGRRHADP